MSNIAEVNDTTFEMEVLQSKQPVLVDFWASWCGPCLAVAPVVDQIAANYEGRLKVTKMNVDENIRYVFDARAPTPCLGLTSASRFRDPLADVRWAILERDVVRFAALEKTDRVLIHEG